MFQAILFIYSILYFIALLIYLPRVVFQAVFRKKRTQILNRIKPNLIAENRIQSRKIIWIHAVSVGEVNAVLALTRKLASDNYKIYFSTTTVTGQQVARSALSSTVTLLYFPLDFKIICRAFFRKIKPDLVVIMETEIWPNFLEISRRENVPVIFINGRISDHSIKNYLRISFLLKPLFKRITFMCMQSDIDADRIKKIGAPEKILRVTGNMKFDYSLKTSPDKQQLLDWLGIKLRHGQESLIWICGSTKSNEEEIISSLYINLKKDFPGLSLLIAPRHPHRGEEVANIFRSKGLRTCLRSRIDMNAADQEKSCDILVLDTVGELAYLYEMGDLVFMGGSLVPTGGQNVIEPAFFGKPILFGPSMTNFREIAEIFTDRNAAVQVRSPQELETQARRLLQNEAERSTLGINARQVLENNSGAVEENLEVIKSIINN